MNFSSILIFSLYFIYCGIFKRNNFGGFPWNLISFSLVNIISSLQILSFIGTYSLNLLVITFYCLPIIILFNIKNLRKFTILLSQFNFIINVYYGFNKN